MIIPMQTTKISKMTGGKIVDCSVLQLHLQVTQTSANRLNCSAGTRFMPIGTFKRVHHAVPSKIAPTRTLRDVHQSAPSTGKLGYGSSFSIQNA